MIDEMIFVGDMNVYGRSYLRWSVLNRIVKKIHVIPYVPLSKIKRKVIRSNLLSRVLWRLNVPINDNLSNYKVIIKCIFSDVTFVWVEKGIVFYPITIDLIRWIRPSINVILFTEDDLCVNHGSSLWLNKAIPKYNSIVTTKLHNRDELYALNANKVVNIVDTYCKDIHRKFDEIPTEKFRSDVCAIGAFEKERYESVLYLANNGIKVTIWGLGWDEIVGTHPLLDIKNSYLFEKDFSKAIAGAKINLNFLRKINRDTITSRSIEIPAIGGFMIAERTEAHTAIFAEEDEAVFFGSNKELLDKVKYYLNNEVERSRISENGYYRIVNGRFEMKQVIEDLLERFSNER